jgi:hypothetical protein
MLPSEINALKNLYQDSIPADLALPGAFWTSYTDSDEKLMTGLCACLAMWAASGRKLISTEVKAQAH